jgi:hypothetical protein
VDVLHVAVHPQLDPHDQFVAHGERPIDRVEHLAGGGRLLGVQGLLERQRRAFVRRDLAHVLEVLPVDGSPTDAVVDLLAVIWTIAGSISLRTIRSS